jgi:ubiquinone/menaquinone biosynthesis C-methylase UbiE
MTNSTNITIETYNKTAKEYEKKVANLHHFEEENFFLKLIGKNKIILDMGCGDGRDLKIFSEKNYQVYGIDLSKELLNLAKKKVPNGILKNMDIRKLDFKDNFFDGIWSVASLLHLEKKDVLKSLKETNRVLKKGGIMCLCVKKGSNEKLILDKRYNSKKFYSYFQKKELENLVLDAGFEILELKIIKPENKYYNKDSEIRLFAKKV